MRRGRRQFALPVQRSLRVGVQRNSFGLIAFVQHSCETPFEMIPSDCGNCRIRDVEFPDRISSSETYWEATIDRIRCRSGGNPFGLLRCRILGSSSPRTHSFRQRTRRNTKDWKAFADKDLRSIVPASNPLKSSIIQVRFHRGIVRPDDTVEPDHLPPIFSIREFGHGSRRHGRRTHA